MKKRIYKRLGNGKAVRTDMVLNTSTNVVEQVPCHNSIVSESAVISNDGLIEGTSVNHNTIVNVESVVGQPQVMRTESPEVDGGMGTDREISLTITTTTDKVTGYLFDGAGFLNGFGNNFTIPATATIGGTYDDKTVEALHNISKYQPTRLHSLHITNVQQGFFTDGKLRLSEAYLDGVPPKETPINMGRTLKPDTFEQSVRLLDKFRFMAAPLWGQYVDIPINQKVTFNWLIRSTENGHIMERV